MLKDGTGCLLVAFFENIDKFQKLKKDNCAAISCYDFVVNVEYTNLVWYVHIDFWRIDNHTIICTDPYAIISYIRVRFHGDEKFNSLVEDLIGGKIHSSENDSCQKMYLLQGKIFNEVALLTAVPANAESMPNVGGYLHKDIVNYFINPYLDSERYFLELFRSDALVRKQKE